MNYLKDELYELIKNDENIFDFIQEASLTGLWYWDLQNPDNHWMHPKFWEMLGYSTPEIPLHTGEWREFVFKEDLVNTQKKIKEHLSNPSHPYEDVIRYKHKNNSTVWVRCKGMSIRDENGNAIRMIGAHINVTEEMRSNLMLANANQRLKAILTHLSDNSFVIDTEYKILESYNSSDFFPNENIIGKKLNELVLFKNGFEKIKAGIAHAVQIKRKSIIECCLHNGNHEEWFNIIVSVLTWEGETPLEFICLFQNVSARKSTELALQKSDERFRIAIDATEGGLWEWNIETGIEYFSERWCEIMGYSKDDPEITYNFDFWASRIHPEDFEYVMLKLQNHLEKGEAFNVEYRHLHKTGKYIWQNSRGKSVFDENGKPTKMLGFISDISQSKESEQKVKQLSVLYQTLLDNVPGYVVCRNYKGEFLFVNQEFAALFGKKPEEVEGLTDEAYGATPEEISFYLQADRKVMDSGKPLFIQEETVLRKDGSRGLFQVTKVPLQLSHQTDKSVLIVAMDVTDRIEAQKALMESEKQLLQKSNILSSIAKMTENLLVSRNINETLRESFDLIGKSTEVDRVYYFERNLHTNLIDYKIEWAAEGTSKEMSNAKLHDMAYEDLGEYMPFLLQNTPYQNIVRNIQNAETRIRLIEQNTLSILLIPIFVKGIFYGFIGFDDCAHERIWSEDELNTFQSLATNISNAIERIHNESIIEQSESNFRQINETIEDVFWLYDIINRKYIYMSPSCENVLEIVQSHFYANTHTPLINVIEEDKYKFCHAEESLHENDSYEIEYRIMVGEGRIKWINEKSFAIRDENGKLIRNSGICSDITEKKRIQSELKQLSLVAEKTTNGVLITDEQGRALWANQAYLDMFEIPLSQLLNKKPNDLFRARLHLEEKERESANATNFTQNMKILTFKGNLKWVELNNTIVTDENGKVVQQVEVLTDTTERKAAEEKLAEERQLLRAIIDNVPINIYVKDLEGKKILANKSEYEFVGAKNEAEVLGKHDFDLYEGDIAKYTNEKDEYVISQNQPLLDFESVIRKKDGTSCWMLSSKIPLRNERQQVVGIVGIGLDITERKQNEAERQIDLEVEKRVNVFAQSIYRQNNIDDLLWSVSENCISNLDFEDVAVYLIDESGTKLFQKAAAGEKNTSKHKIENPLIISIGEGIVGDVVQRSIAEIIPDTTLDKRYIRDGMEGLSEIAIPIIFNGKVIGIIDSEHSQRGFYQPKHLRILSTIATLVANRIDRILAEEKVKESEERFRFIAENTSDGIFVTEDKIVTYTSPSCEKILGYTFEDFHKLSQNYDLLDLVHPDDVQGFRDVIQEIVEKQQKSFNYEYRTRNRNGGYIWREDNINIVYDEEGNPQKFIIVIRDTTEKVEKKQQLQHLLDVTSKQNERLMNFAHIVSHNIRSHSSNLSMIVNFMGAVENEDNGLNYFDMLKQSTDKLSETIENLNEIITIQNNINKPKMDLYIYDEIQKTLKVLNTIILANNAVIINEIPKFIHVKGIASYMESIFLNMLTNALKYRSPERAPIVHFSAEIRNNYLILSIKDNGVGIDLKMHGHKIFGMYKTFHKNADARGIGLFITKNQIEAMNGRIEVESEVGQGTTFKIYFYMENE